MKNQPTRHTGRHFLQIPGPTNVPDRVLHAIAAPTIDHRGPEFAELGQEVVAGMKRVFRTDGTVEGHFVATGVRPRFLAELEARGIKIPGSVFDPSKPL